MWVSNSRLGGWCRAPRSVSRQLFGPGSTSAAPSCQQPIARSAPRWRQSISLARGSGLMLLQRSHRQARFLQLLPVVLGGLARPGPDRGLAAAVDLVRDRVATV